MRACVFYSGGVKTKKRNRLACENDLRITVSETKPRIFQLVARKEQQKAKLIQQCIFFVLRLNVVGLYS